MITHNGKKMVLNFLHPSRVSNYSNKSRNRSKRNHIKKEENLLAGDRDQKVNRNKVMKNVIFLKIRLLQRCTLLYDISVHFCCIRMYTFAW